MVSGRIEKHAGVTLVVEEHGWITVVWDATGHSVVGPVESDDDIKPFVQIAIDTLKILASTMQRDRAK